MSRFLRSLAASLGKEDKDEDEAKETDSTIEEKGGSVAERVLQISERLGDDKPAEVGGQVGKRVSPTTRSNREHLGGDHPGETAQAEVERDREADDERQGEPGDLTTWAQDCILILMYEDCLICDRFYQVFCGWGAVGRVEVEAEAEVGDSHPQLGGQD